MTTPEYQNPSSLATSVGSSEFFKPAPDPPIDFIGARGTSPFSVSRRPGPAFNVTSLGFGSADLYKVSFRSTPEPKASPEAGRAPELDDAEPDRDAIEREVLAIAGDVDFPLFWYAIDDQDGTSKRVGEFIAPDARLVFGSVDDVWEHIHRWQTSGYGLMVLPAVLSPMYDGTRHPTTEDIIGLLANIVDYDGKDEKAAAGVVEHLRSHGLDFRVTRSEGGRLKMINPCRDPSASLSYAPPAMWRQQQEALAERTWSDVMTVTSKIRPAGSIRWKGGKPVRIQLLNEGEPLPWHKVTKRINAMKPAPESLAQSDAAIKRHKGKVEREKADRARTTAKDVQSLRLPVDASDEELIRVFVQRDLERKGIEGDSGRHVWLQTFFAWCRHLGADGEFGSLVGIVEELTGLPKPEIQSIADWVMSKVDPDGDKTLLENLRVMTRPQYGAEFWSSMINAAEMFIEHQAPHIRRWHNGFYDFNGALYVQQDEEALNKRVEEFILPGQLAMGTKYVPAKFIINDGHIKATLSRLTTMRLLDPERKAPFWISGTGPDPRGLILCRNAIVDITTGKAMDPNPDLFCINALDVDYDPNATCPIWFRCLDDWFPGDEHARQCLQEVIGYLISSDNRAQKIFAFIGDPRAGKGTTTDILSNLAGRYNIAYPRLHDFRGDYTFGLEKLVGKNLAILNEVSQIGHRHIGAVVATLKAYSGGDRLETDRKFKSAVETSDVRFLLVGQTMPNLKDPSGALAMRMIGLKFEQSFVDREDKELRDKLRRELPGILNWAIAGYRRYLERGRFELHRTGEDMRNELLRNASMVRMFINDDDWCVVGETLNTTKDELYQAFEAWAKANRVPDEMVTRRNRFFTDLQTECPQVRVGAKAHGKTGQTPVHGVTVVFGR